MNKSCSRSRFKKVSHALSSIGYRLFCRHAIFAFCFSMFPLTKGNAKSPESFHDSIGMQFFIDGKVQEDFSRWNIVCSKGCVIETAELHCRKSVDYFSVDKRFFSTDDGTLAVIGDWTRGVATISFKDGSESWTCQFTVNDSRQITDAKCKSKSAGHDLMIKMPDRDIPWREECGSARFKGKRP